MNQYIWIAVAVAGLAGDIIAIGLGQHSRKHEKVNAAATPPAWLGPASANAVTLFHAPTSGLPFIAACKQ